MPSSLEEFDLDGILSSGDEDNPPNLPIEYEYYEYSDGVHSMTEEEMEEYRSALKESEGFDIPSFPNSYGIGLIVPLTEESLVSEGVSVYAEEAIKHYNKENDTNYEVVKIVKANDQASCGIMYFITFEVKEIGTPPDFPTTTFQAQVLSGIPDTIEVELCRPKSSGICDDTKDVEVPSGIGDDTKDVEVCRPKSCC